MDAEHPAPAALTAWRHRPAALLAAVAALSVAALVATGYGLRAWAAATGTGGGWADWAWAPLALALAVQTGLYLAERPVRATPAQQRALDRLDVAVLVPLYNEDPGYLRTALHSLLTQTRPPQSAHVVDDGSTTGYADLRTEWLAAAARAGVRATWQRRPNRGKRAAQVAAAAHCPGADVLVTVDSDAHLDPHALHELLQPLADPKVQAVAGVVLAHNNRHGLISRITDLWYVTNQLVDRSALSPLGAVMVCSGSLAAYRADLLTDHREQYLGETFAGRPVTFSDDSLLTFYALRRGRVVQQPSAVVFSVMPENVGHHLRQYLRWMRGSTIRSLWRVRYLPLGHPALLVQVLRWYQHLAATATAALLLTHTWRTGTVLPPALLAVPPLIVAGQTLRYLTVRRSDQPVRSQLATWALTPLAAAWSWTVLRPLRWYAALTCLRTGWGTRQHGPEVALAPAAARR
ncbi:glycosyltransferase family 2 protein [Kitasatospora cineracea]|uniref:Hyaluronan synthase n=1 Tax=Kitasatospora cineracea TaxID=88074 RepID=A0A8G1ULJ0_9ACTN|nr:glycosyltransferase family 2 protein [Kitasatospora cineracea]ROR46238.1 hyaluronan synthase [Kitasatospora cineracea]